MASKLANDWAKTYGYNAPRWAVKAAVMIIDSALAEGKLREGIETAQVMLKPLKGMEAELRNHRRDRLERHTMRHLVTKFKEHPDLYDQVYWSFADTSALAYLVGKRGGSAGYYKMQLAVYLLDNRDLLGSALDDVELSELIEVIDEGEKCR